MSLLFINKALRLNNLKTRTAINAKISVFVICVKAITYFFTARKVTKYGVFFDPYFPVLGLNTEIYSVNLRIQSKYRKIRARKNAVFGHLSRFGYYIICMIVPLTAFTERSYIIKQTCSFHLQLYFCMCDLLVQAVNYLRCLTRSCL